MYSVVTTPSAKGSAWRSGNDHLRFVSLQILVQMFDFLTFSKINTNIDVEGVSSFESSSDAYAGSASVATENLTYIVLTRVNLIVTQGSIC